MSDFWQDDPQDGSKFSWDEWVYTGLRALRRLLFNYDLGLPDAFWRHLQIAVKELLAAMRILMKTARDRKQSPESPAPPPKRNAIDIDIDWDE